MAVQVFSFRVLAESCRLGTQRQSIRDCRPILGESGGVLTPTVAQAYLSAQTYTAVVFKSQSDVAELFSPCSCQPGYN